MSNLELLAQEAKGLTLHQFLRLQVKTTEGVMTYTNGIAK
jgi:hypothetical protein